MSWQHDFARRVDLADICIAAHSGVALIQEAAQRAEPTAQAHLLRTWASDLSALLAQSTQAGGCDVAALKRVALEPAFSALAQRHPDLRLAHTHPQRYAVRVERERARFSAWYEFFPRSASNDAQRHGTFADCEA